MLCKFSRPSLLAYASLSAAVFVWTARPATAGDVSDAVETLNLMIDKVTSETERADQRKQMQSLANYLTQPNYQQ
ncbi:MAG: hypothetical protein MI757_18325, partial [Pirellulales bacterium]|nr:hypothetical protein [Pirellulales bacterium]